jgi:hypothetical protein
MADRDYTPYQRKVISRYYEHHDAIQVQKLSELITEIYLAEGKKRDRLWKQVGEALTRLGFPATRVEHLLARREVTLLPAILKELEARGK